MTTKAKFSVHGGDDFEPTISIDLEDWLNDK
jgi:hypothetical protein